MRGMYLVLLVLGLFECAHSQWISGWRNHNSFGRFGNKWTCPPNPPTTGNQCYAPKQDNSVFCVGNAVWY